MNTVQKIRLFLSSPGDVEPERAKVHAVAEQVNRMLGNSLGIILDVIDWKTHIVPDMGRPQEVINQQVGDYDIFIGILWKRFGTPTGKAESGTEEEFNIAYANWQKYGRPRILFYFSQVPYMPKNPSEGGQFLNVLKFKAKFWEQQTGLVMDYQTPEEFSDLLREHLVKVLQEWFKPKTGIPHHPLRKKNAVGMRISFTQKSVLVTALLQCDAMGNPYTRQTVVNELPDEIKNSLHRGNTSNDDVMNIVTTCLNFQDGLKVLIQIVRHFENNSLGMQEVDNVIRDFNFS
jgi:hypothetical protein